MFYVIAMETTEKISLGYMKKKMKTVTKAYQY